MNCPVVGLLVCLALANFQTYGAEKGELAPELGEVIKEINALMMLKYHVDNKPISGFERKPSNSIDEINDVGLTIPQAQAMLQRLKLDVAGGEIKKEQGDKRTDDPAELVGKWNFPIKYTFAEPETTSNIYSDIEKNVIREGLEWWASSTCISFVEYPNSQSVGSSPHLVFTKGTGCQSLVGLADNTIQHNVSLGADCLYRYGFYQPGVVAHEIGHALGLSHEHQRPDRDLYLRLNSVFLYRQSWFNYAIAPFALDYGLGYDPTSIMQYASLPAGDRHIRAWETVDPYQLASQGQRTSLSYIDVKRINLHYNCSAWSCFKMRLPRPCQNGGYQDPKNCARCRCPPGIGGDFCDIIPAPSTGSMQCGGIVQVEPCSTVAIASPNYPNKYAPESTCAWLIQTSASGLIFGFEPSLDLPCAPTDTCIDFVEIRTNISELDKPGDRFCGCGVSTGRVAEVDGGQAFVYFASTTARFGGGDRFGFKLNIFATCGSTLASDFTSECMISKSGYDYEGSMAIADSGNECLCWSSQTEFPAMSFPDDNLTEAGNYCRNPSGDVAPWCYTDTESKDKSKEFCSTKIPKCENLKRQSFVKEALQQEEAEKCQSRTRKQSKIKAPIEELYRFDGNRGPYFDYPAIHDIGCRKTSQGTDYVGTLSTTRYGFTCQRWDTDYPHDHAYKSASLFPDGSVSGASNYCRNPDPSHLQGVWCLTTDPLVRWDLCAVPLCRLNLTKEAAVGSTTEATPIFVNKKPPPQSVLFSSSNRHDHRKKPIGAYIPIVKG